MGIDIKEVFYRGIDEPLILALLRKPFLLSGTATDDIKDVCRSNSGDR